MNPRISIAIPASLVAELSHLREKTRIIGRIGRSAAIFRVNEILVYPDKPDESSLIKSLLTYMETPQYLRRYLIKKQPEFRYVGSLPPLRTPHHQIKKRVKDLSIGEYREGVVVEKKGNKTKVEIGVEQLINLKGTSSKKGSRTTVRIKKIHPKLVGEIYEKDQIPLYWGFSVKTIKTSLREFLTRNDFDLSIATSRLGASINQRWEPVKTDIMKSHSIIVAFGSYKEGLHSILGGEVEMQNLFDHYLNTIPNQGVATVRTEEAIHTTLGILNTMMQ